MKKIIKNYHCDICGSDECTESFNGKNVLLKCKTCKYLIKECDQIDIDSNFKNIIEHYSYNGSENILHNIVKGGEVRNQKEVLDVGCWDGSLLDCLPENWVKYGVEPNCIAADRARKKKINIFQSKIETTDFKDEKFDLVLLIDVMEHLSKPLLCLAKIRSILKPEGELIILTGNTESFGCRFFKQNWYYYHYDSHISFFNKDNLSLLLNQSGLIIHDAIKTKHYTTSITSLLKRIVEFKKRRKMVGISKIEMGSNSTNLVFIFLSRLIKNRDHMIIKCGKAWNVSEDTMDNMVACAVLGASV
jgi:SAM-dependent methyltransferase